MDHPSRPGPGCLAVAVLLAGQFAWTAAAAADDLTGTWRLSSTNAAFEFVQTGPDVVATDTSTSRVYEGAIDGTTVELASDDPPDADSYALELAPDGSVLVGTHDSLYCAFSICTPVSTAAEFARCECVDGNDVGGDGCDVRCRIEPCFSCSGTPSVCSPLPDDTPCESRSDCTLDGTCRAGVCEGDAVAAPCTDLQGGWLRARFEGGVTLARNEVVQEDGELRFYEVPGGVLVDTGSVSASGDALRIDGTVAFPANCYDPGDLDGAVDADGHTYAAIGREHIGAISTECLPGESIRELGVRCAPPALAGPDACAVESCRACSGSPETCVDLPDSTPCVSEDPCTVLATCSSGQCVASISDSCPSCTRCSESGCVAAPRENCRPTESAKTSALTLKHPETESRSLLRWTWKRGTAVRPFELGRPDIRSEVALCVFDESTSTPARISSASIPAASVFSPDPNLWEFQESGRLRFRDRDGSSGGIQSVQMRAGTSKKSSLKLTAKGDGLLDSVDGFPTPPLATPLRVQLQVEGGACFEGRYDAGGVAKNSAGVFRAKGTP